MAFDQSLVEDILKSVDIVDVISSYIHVIKKGRSYVALCPFHDDKNPSLMISKEKQLFKCFVCGTGGNAITFVQKYEKISFNEALKKVADIAGYHDERLDKAFSSIHKVDEETSHLFDCIKELQKFYVYCLNSEEGKIAQEYLEKRNISQQQIQKFGLGYSLNDGRKTIAYLQSKGYSVKTIEDIGISLARSEGMSDSNAGRLIFPITNLNGQVIGFSARRLNDNTDESKYVNSPETKLFHKGNVLYNMSNAYQTARKDGFLYCVEGFMDAFALDQIGINSVIALMGTALSKENALVLRRINVELRLCLDSDKPGQMATMKAMSILDNLGIPYRLVYAKDCQKDPDEILKKDGEEKLKEYVNSLVSPLDYAVTYYKNNATINSVEERKKIVFHFLPLLVKMSQQNTEDSNFILDNYIDKIADVTQFSKESIKNLISKSKERESTSNDETNINGYFTSNFKPEHRHLRKLQLAEREFLYQMLNSHEAVEYYTKNLDYFFDEIYRNIANYIIEYEDQHKEMNIANLISELSASDMPNKDNMIDEITSLSVENDHPNYNESYVEDCTKTIKDEMNSLYQRETLEKAMEGKSEKEKARLINDYINQKNKAKSN